MSSYIDALSNGVVGDGVHDDTAAIQACVNLAMSSGSGNFVIFFGACTPLVSSTITISGGGLYSPACISIRGSGPFGTVFKPNASFNVFNIDTIASGIGFEDFGIEYANGSSTSGAIAIQDECPSTTASNFHLFKNIQITNAYTGFQLIGTYLFRIDSCWVNAYIGYGVIVQNTADPDEGDSVIVNSEFSTGFQPGDVGASATGIYQRSAGGLRIVNNKINGGAFGYQMQLLLDSTYPGTGCLIIVGNSLENQNQYTLVFQRAAATYTFVHVVIAANEFDGYVNSGNTAGTPCLLLIPDDANGTWLTNVSITGNVFRLKYKNSTAVSIGEGCSNVIFGQNALLALQTGCVAVSGNLTDSVIGPNQTTGFATIYSFSSTTVAIQSRTVKGSHSVSTTSTTVIPGIYTGTAAVSLSGFLAPPRCSSPSLMPGRGRSARFSTAPPQLAHLR